MAKFWAINEEIMHQHCSNDHSNHNGYYDLTTIVTTMVTVINHGYHRSN